MPRETPINKVLISQKEDWRMKILGQLNVYKRAPHYVEVIELVKSTWIFKMPKEKEMH